MSTAPGKNGTSVENRTAKDSETKKSAYRPAQSTHASEPAIISQIPALDIANPAVNPRPTSEGRIISQLASMRLLVGMGLALVVGATLPYIFNRGGRTTPAVKELPAWQVSGPSTPLAPPSVNSTAPAWPTTPPTSAANPAPAATPSPAYLTAQPPQVGANRPMALNEPAWPQAQIPSDPPRNTTVVAPTIPVPSNPPLNPVSGNLPNDPRLYQADARNNAAAAYRGDYRNEVRRDAAAVPAQDYRNPATAMRPDYRDYRNDNRDPYSGSANGGSPLMPANQASQVANPQAYAPQPNNAMAPGGATAPAANYRDTQYVEPGVARFDGTIATPPVRTSSYDNAGPSIH